MKLNMRRNAVPVAKRNETNSSDFVDCVNEPKFPLQNCKNKCRIILQTVSSDRYFLFTKNCSTIFLRTAKLYVI